MLDKIRHIRQPISTAGTVSRRFIPAGPGRCTPFTLEELTVVTILYHYTWLTASSTTLLAQRVVEQLGPELHILLGTTAVQLDRVKTERNCSVHVSSEAYRRSAVVTASTIVVICAPHARSGSVGTTRTGCVVPPTHTTQPSVSSRAQPPPTRPCLEISQYQLLGHHARRGTCCFLARMYHTAASNHPGRCRCSRARPVSRACHRCTGDSRPPAHLWQPSSSIGWHGTGTDSRIATRAAADQQPGRRTRHQYSLVAAEGNSAVGLVCAWWW